MRAGEARDARCEARENSNIHLRSKYSPSRNSRPAPRSSLPQHRLQRTHDDRVLFEFLILEGAQAGLSWATILAKRENYRAAFAQFDPAKLARFTAKQEAALMKNEGIVRNRLKIASVAINARAFLEVQQEFGSFDEFVWQFVNGAPLQNEWKSFSQVPARTLQSDALSKELKRRGFKFIGSTICYAFMASAPVRRRLVSLELHSAGDRAGATPDVLRVPAGRDLCAGRSSFAAKEAGKLATSRCVAQCDLATLPETAPHRAPSVS